MKGLTQRAQLLKKQLVSSKRGQFSSLLINFIQENGQSRYDESVTQTEHALQAADLASQSGAEPTLIAAALLHDIGHLLIDEFSERDNFLAVDQCHEIFGARFLEPYMPAELLATIRLHVLAKRYLCSTQEAYIDQLSKSSKRSFELQGGLLSSEELKTLESEPYLASALKIRVWDDQAKVTGKEVPPLNAYANTLAEVYLPS